MKPLHRVLLQGVLPVSIPPKPRQRGLAVLSLLSQEKLLDTGGGWRWRVCHCVARVAVHCVSKQPPGKPSRLQVHGALGITILACKENLVSKVGPEFDLQNSHLEKIQARSHTLVTPAPWRQRQANPQGCLASRASQVSSSRPLSNPDHKTMRITPEEQD